MLGAWNSQDGNRLAALMAQDGTYEDVAVGQTMDRESIVDLIARTHTLSSDHRLEWMAKQRSGNDYAAEWLMSGINDGPAPELGLEATGKPFAVRGASVGQLDERGLIKVHRDYWNLLAS